MWHLLTKIDIDYLLLGYPLYSTFHLAQHWQSNTYRSVIFDPIAEKFCIWHVRIE
jgi:hypothetical protein